MLTCSACNYSSLSDKDSGRHHLDITEGMIVGAYSAGIGYSAWKSLLNCLEVSFVSKKFYLKHENAVGVRLQSLLEEDLTKNIEATKQFAAENGNCVNVDGVSYPTTTVIVDGGWSKRSYGHSFNSNAGVAVIISQPIQKVIYVGYRVKSCKQCEYNPDKLHICHKNWDLSAQAMESNIITEGFREVFDKHQLIFKYVVGDADSSVYAKIQQTVSYPGRIIVEKIDCANHAVRGLNSRIHRILKNTAFVKKDRDIIRS